VPARRRPRRPAGPRARNPAAPLLAAGQLHGRHPGRRLRLGSSVAGAAGLHGSCHEAGQLVAGDWLQGSCLHLCEDLCLCWKLDLCRWGGREGGGRFVGAFCGGILWGHGGGVTGGGTEVVKLSLTNHMSAKRKASPLPLTPNPAAAPPARPPCPHPRPARPRPLPRTHLQRRQVRWRRLALHHRQQRLSRPLIGGGLVAGLGLTQLFPTVRLGGVVLERPGAWVGGGAGLGVVRRGRGRGGGGQGGQGAQGRAVTGLPAPLGVSAAWVPGLRRAWRRRLLLLVVVVLPPGDWSLCWEARWEEGMGGVISGRRGGGGDGRRHQWEAASVGGGDGRRHW